ncbi:MAG: hypothetical protein EZS28_023235 [Streblomastix strix]|uniref:Uncharacterized protein n=1 Tax=Streblomastix strix TaxID=222440 RepID=A0A5J4VF94_9EUKA|nr:MAG: hypothetical protein EZS28_023235 [Streblomastix strix]
MSKDQSKEQISSRSELIGLTVITRHGDRNPVHKINYIHENLSYDGELLQKGKDRLENIGKKIREKYFSILKLSDEYQEDKFLFRSTEVKRTIDSLQSFSKGLFPKLNKQVIMEELPNNDILLLGLSGCPKALATMMHQIQGEELVQYEKTNELWIKQVKQILKSNDSGYPLPEGMNEDLYNKAAKGRDDIFHIILPFNDRKWCDASSGFFYNEV